MFQIFAPRERTFILVFRREERLVGMTSSTWNFGSDWLPSSKNADFQTIFARSGKSSVNSIGNTTKGPLHTLNQMVNQMVNHLVSC